ncbi:hypothetical protein ASPSYDRAFT_42545 [Aspergillus sydowii CBS 593.65]|uniref:Uncharacterized protein n=1 Tax=Aspergillus sydowii CBS 593.65 TaxID=1036612 RepID=A0A1L9TMX7_9EURO|nr:uncharacterized protein ASPSYDRAFT_42545 [Aspergillus sydowii CBS 593.65]OJJ60765.1 hypothetical protein ASPSYDRAFT_42545 [Aspergillus sydowii CBS 593.65]
MSTSGSASVSDSSYILPTPTSSTPSPRSRGLSYTSVDSLGDEIASLPSETTSASDLETLSDYSDAEAEWQESIEQLELLLTMVIVPFVGKFLGRKCAYWSWTRFMEWKYPIDGVVEKGSGPRAGSVKTFASL